MVSSGRMPAASRSSHLVGVLFQVLGILDGGQGVQVHDAIDALVIVLQGNVVLDRTQVVSQVGAPGWADAGEDPAFFGHSGLTIMVF